MTGAQVNIFSVQPHEFKEDLSVIDAWVVYPAQSTVDLRKLPIIANEIYGRDYTNSQTKQIQTATVYRDDFDMIFWILVGLILATIIFLIILLICWCCYFRPGTYR